MNPRGYMSKILTSLAVASLLACSGTTPPINADNPLLDEFLQENQLSLTREQYDFVNSQCSEMKAGAYSKDRVRYWFERSKQAETAHTNAEQLSSILTKFAISKRTCLPNGA